MKNNRSIPQILFLLLLSVAALWRPAQCADGQRAHQVWYNPHSGITGSVWTYVPVHPTPFSPPNPPAPEPYQGTLSVFSDAGRFVTTVTTGGDFGNFTVYLKSGVYVIVP